MMDSTMTKPTGETSQWETLKGLLPLLWPKAETVLVKHGIDAALAPYACVHSVARMIVVGQAQLAPAIGKAIAIEAIVGASKTVPPALTFA